MKISDKGIAIIKAFESLHDGNLTLIGLQPKADPAGIMTVGYGHALKKSDGSWVRNISDVDRLFPQYANIDEAMACKLLAEDCTRFENGVNALGLTINQNQFDALVSFSFNVGSKALQDSTLLKRIRGIVQEPSIADCFAMWNKSGGVILKGLTLRRAAESRLYLS